MPVAEPVIVPVLEPVIVPAAEPVIVPALDPVIVPTLLVREPVIVPPRAADESDRTNAAVVKVTWNLFIFFLLVDSRLLGMAGGET